MKHATQVEVLKELLHQIDTDTTCDAGRIVVNPASAYTDPALADREWKAFFQQHPQVIGLTPELPRPGSYFTNSDLGMPILATRDQNGKFHAFINACRHRGSQLTDDTRGEKHRFVCPFHSWTFGSDGSLIGVRRSDMFGKIDKACHNLIELPSQEKYGFLVVHPQADGVVDIDALLGAELAEELSAWNFDQCEFLGESSIDKELNWKLANDTFGENYHFGSLHKDTLSKLAYGDYTSYREYGRHHRICTASRYLDTMRHQPEAEWNLAFASVAAYYLFPNIQMVFVGGMLMLVRIYPDRSNVAHSISRISHFGMPQVKASLSSAASAATVVAENVYQMDASARPEFDLSATVELFASTVEHEDYAAGVKTQIAASSGQLKHFLFGRNEPALHHFHNNYRAALGEGPLTEYRAE